jgi:CDP-glucose 4,6-dehydratase
MNFWKNKKVFITGHTGFKGSWLCLYLYQLEAKVSGYALNPPTDPSLFKLCGIDDLMNSTIADIRDLGTLKKAMLSASPDIVIHMAAQPLVRQSYKDPVETYSVNVMGTVNLLESVRSCKSIKAVVNVTTDKIYENKERQSGYKENEPLGGYDPYSSSKACSELVTSAYRNSFLNNGVAVATARAGNVIGGGDWGSDRLVPDFIRAILNGEKIRIRNPKAVRPWQYVLDPLNGYLMLAQMLYENGQKYAQAWNFGPADKDAKTVEWLVNRLCSSWGKGASYSIDKGKHPHETRLLTLNSSKAKTILKWKPKMDIEGSIDNIIAWTRAYKDKKDMRKVSLDQISGYMEGKTK